MGRNPCERSKVVASMVKYRRITTKQIADALRETGGVVNLSARLLGIDPSNLRKRIRREPELQAVLEACREDLADLAEAQLKQKILEGDLNAITFVLRTLGKGRGYSERLFPAKPLPTMIEELAP